MKSKIGANFSSGIALILAAVAISLFAFISEGNKITGLVVSTETSAEQSLMQFGNVNELATLNAGNYFIDSDGIVYWLDDESKPAIAKVSYVDESHKNRHIYIDEEGRIGYVLGTFP